MARVYGNKVTNTSSGKSRTWRLYADYSVSSTETAYTIKGTSLGVQNTASSSNTTMSFNANSLTVSYSGVLTASYKRTTKTGSIKGGATFEVYGTDKSAVIERTRVAQTKSLTFKCVANSNTAWDGTSTKTVSFTIPARSSHIVSYDANGGSGSIPSFTKFYSATGETAYYETLSDGSGFSKAGYRVAEWNTMPDGSGTSYPISGYYTANGTTAVTLYAQWQATYVKPEIQNLLAFRVADASGGASPTVTSTGEMGFCKFELVGGANYTFDSATVQFGTATAKSMTKNGTTLYGYSDVDSIAQTSAYTVKITVVVTGTDGISRTYTDSTYISKAVPVFDATPNSFALGGVARDVTGDEKPFDCYMDAYFNGKVNANDADFNGNMNVLGRVTTGKAISIPCAHYSGTSGSKMISNATTFYKLSAFSGYTASHMISDDSYFEADSNGFKVLKSGTYFLILNAHYNTSDNSTQMATRFLDYTGNVQIGNTMFNCNPVPWGMLSNHVIAHINANHIVVPEFQKYSTATSSWKPSVIKYSMILLMED